MNLTFSTEPDQKTLWKTIGNFLLLLLIAQCVRAGLSWLLVRVLDLPWDTAHPITFLGMAAALAIIVRPSWRDLGLDLHRCSKRVRILYALGVLFLLLMVAGSYFLDPGMLLINLTGVLIVPIVEEMLFRGLGWSRISAALPQKNNNLFTWIIISVLFGLWHLAYADVLLLYVAHPVQPSELAYALLMKFLIGGFIGGLAGLVRWKTARLPASFIVHGLINLFGR